MSETVKLSFNDGYKNIEFNGDPNKVIRINPTDGAFLERLAGFKDRAREIADKYGDIDLSALDKLKEIEESEEPVEGDRYDTLKAAAESTAQIEKATRELIDSIFESPVCETIFGESSCLSPVNGRPVYFGFLDIITDYIAQEMKKNIAERERKISKYTDKAKQITVKPESISAPQTKQIIPLAKPTAAIDVSSLTDEQRNELLKQLLP